MGMNLYDVGGGVRRYINTAAAGQFFMNANEFGWETAASGTAGTDMTLTRRMTLSSAGALSVASVTANVSGNVSAGIVSMGTNGTLGWGTSTMNNNMLTLYGGSGVTLTDVYGFGVNGFVLRYNAAVSASHIWYVNNVETLKSNVQQTSVTGNLRVVGNVVSTADVSGVNANFSGSLTTKPQLTITTATHPLSTTDCVLRFNVNCVVTLLPAATYPGRILYLSTVNAVTVTSANVNVIPLGSSTAGTAILSNATAGKFAMLTASAGGNWLTIMAN